MRADLIALGLHVGWAAFSNAATPLMCGHDIDVPTITSIHHVMRSNRSLLGDYSLA
jgi:hypothetical protein